MVKKRRGKQPRQAEDGGDGGEDNGWRSDPRFGHLATDPRYRSASARKATRVEIDSRFKAMFSDPDFTTDARSDKRGRPVAMSSRQDLRRFYGLKKDEEAGADSGDDEEEEAEEDVLSAEEDEEDEESADETVKSAEEDNEEEDEEEEEENEEEEEEAEAEKAESSSEDEEFRALERSAAAGSLDDAGAAVEPTSRLAVTQQDWDQLKATDLFMLLGCRCQAEQGRRLLSVTVYPSRFGQRRMAAEATSGPLELAAAAAAAAAATGKKTGPADSAAYHRSLRRHQMKRLWYYYAVAEFDSAETAASIYEQCSGLEIESTGGCLRISYIPEGMQFGGPDDVPEEWRHLVTRCTGIDPAAYKPSKFATASLGRTRVGITWDATPAERTRYLQGLFAKEEFDEADPDLKRLSEFLAMSSEEEDDGDADAGGARQTKAAALAARRRALLGKGGGDAAAPVAAEDEQEVAAFSDDELPDDVAGAVAPITAAASSALQPAAPAGAESRKRSRRRRLREQAKRAKLTKAGLLSAAGGGGGGGSSSSDGEEDDEKAAPAAMPASEQELAMLVADRSTAAAGRVTAADVASDARFGALFNDPSYHVDPTHSEAAKAAEVQRLIVSAKRRAAMDT